MAVFGNQEQDHDEQTDAPEQGAAGGDHDENDHGDGQTAGHEEGSHEGHHHGDMSTMEGRKDYFLSTDHLLDHVRDHTYFEYPSFDGEKLNHFDIPNPFPFTAEKPLIKSPAGLEKFIGPTTLAPTKFMVLQVMAALLIAAVFIPYARRVRNGDYPKGRFWQLVDFLICYIKEQVAEPAIGKSDAKRFLPLVWTLFFFILALNLFGMIPGVGAATGSISVTIALALVVFVSVIYTGSKKMGILGFWQAQVPHMDLPFGLGYILVPMIWLIEVFGLFVKHVVLAVRLFANMFAGHLVMAVFAAFIAVVGTYAVGFVVGPASLALSMLELMVAFIQAYVFAFLAALFIGAAVHPH